MSKRKLEVGIMPVMGDGEGIVSEGIVQRAKPKWEWPFGMEEGGLGQRMGGEEEDDEREITIREASSFESAGQAAKVLRLDYNVWSRGHDFKLRGERTAVVESVSEDFAAVIQQLQTNPYLDSPGGEVFSRTFYELILIDRLQKLQGGRRQLRLSTDVPLEIRVKNIYGNNEIVRDRANWAIGHGRDKNDKEVVLLVVKGKHSGAAWVALARMMVCMAAALESRRDRTNNGVFGMLAESGTFQFAFLGSTKKLFLSNVFKWSSQQSTILAYVDAVLLEGIQTTQYALSAKKSFQRYPRSLNERWKYGDEEGDEEAEEGGSDEAMDVAKDQGGMVMRNTS